jgi:hypothetical protein
MPTVTEDTITAQASCTDGRCPGYEQVEVQAVKRLNQWSYVELGGDLPGIERTSSQVFFANEEDTACPFCGKPRIVDDQIRPEYPNMSGQDPLAIFNRAGAAAQMREVIADQARREVETAQLRATLAEQSAQMERMAALVERQAEAIDELQARPRGPGRPRSVPKEGE